MRNAEVDDLRSVLAQDDVGGLQITVDDALSVHRHQCLQQAHGEQAQQMLGEAARKFLDVPLQRQSLDVLDGYVGRICVDVCRQHAGCALHVDPSEQTCFTEEAIMDNGIAGQGRREQAVIAPESGNQLPHGRQCPRTPSLQTRSPRGRDQLF